MVEPLRNKDFLRALKDFHELLQKVPFLLKRAENEENKQEVEILSLIKRVIIDGKWFDSIWAKYPHFLSKKEDPFLTLLKREDKFGRTTGIQLINAKVTKYLKQNNPSRELTAFFNEYLELMNTFETIWNQTPKEKEIIFWENYKPKKTTYQQKLQQPPYKSINLRIILFPSSQTVNLAYEIKENSFPENLQHEFLQYYLKENVLPEHQLQLFFNQLSQIVKEIMKQETVQRHYGPSSTINLQIELRNIPSQGLFTKIFRKKNTIKIMFTPDHTNLIISLHYHYIFNYKDLEDTLYHELLHNLDTRSLNYADEEELKCLNLIRAELITETLTTLSGKNYPLLRMKNSTALLTEIKDLKEQKITSFQDLASLLQPSEGEVHDLSFLIGLQLLCASLKLGDCSEEPKILYNLVISSKESAINHMKTISTLSTSKLFRYYKQKIPKESSYFTEKFLDEIIQITT